MNEILKYFPELSEEQKERFSRLDVLYRDWNEKINIISRKDIDALFQHHVLHSLAIARAFNFRPGTEILDLGTGGGFPGIPLAIFFPKCHFTLIDGTKKKIMVVNEVKTALKLDNVTAIQRRGEDEKGKYDFIVSRAVMPLPDLVKTVRKNISKVPRNSMGNGIICLKGGSLDNEIKPFSKQCEILPISQWFSEEWFNEKSIIYLPI